MVLRLKQQLRRKRWKRAVNLGLQEGRQEERARIGKALERKGITITPEIARILEDESEQRS